jgi:hypothetical protein
VSDYEPRNEPRDAPDRAAPAEESVRVVRVGHGANCSSIGSVIDTLFATAAVGAAVFAAVVAALTNEPVRVVGKSDPRERDAPQRTTPGDG